MFQNEGSLFSPQRQENKVLQRKLPAVITDAPKSSQQQSSVTSSVWGKVSWGDSRIMRILGVEN